MTSMNGIAFRLAAALAATAAIGVGAGVAFYISASSREDEVISQVEIPTTDAVSLLDCVPDGVAIPAATPSDPSAPKFIPVNPEQGLSDNERRALHERLWNESQLNYAAWVECVTPLLNTIDLRSVPTYSQTIDFGPGQPALPDAVAKAELIVVGSVIGFSPIPRGGTLTTLAVEETLKGSPAATVTYMQGSQISPTEDWTGVTVSEAPNEGLLVPGDRAVLLLQRNDEGVYLVQHVSGWFRIVDGSVKANGYNDWSVSVNGRSEADFVQQLTAALQ